MSQLLDHHGRPVRRRELTKRKADAGVVSVRQAWAGSVASGLTPVALGRILQAADEGDIEAYVRLAQEMEERDAHYFAVLGSRKRAVSAIRPVVEPVTEEKSDDRIAKAVEEQIAKHDDFPGLVEDLLDAIGKGFSVVEIDWARSKSQWWPNGYNWVDPRFIRFDRETGRVPHLIDEADPADGIPLEPYQFAYHRAGLKSGLDARGGVARVVAFGWMCKAYTLKDWMAFVELYGLPLRLGRYDAAATPEDVEKLYQAVANIGTDAAAVLPRTMEIDFEATSAGPAERIFENLARYIDEQVSKAVLGQTMTSDDGSSQAQAKVHNDVRYDIAASDARAVSATINRDIVRPFVDLNFGVQKAYPKIVLHIDEPEDTEATMRSVIGLLGQGVAFRSSELRQRLGFSDPEKGEEVVGGQPLLPKAQNRSEDIRPDDELEDLGRELDEEWEEVMVPLLSPIDRAVEEAETYEELLELLQGLPEDMNAGTLIDSLVRKMATARMLGDARDG